MTEKRSSCSPPFDPVRVSKIYEKPSRMEVKSYCLSKCHPGFAAFLYVSEHGSRRQLRLLFLLLGPCRSQLRLPRCMCPHLTGPLLTHVGASKPCERADVGARL